MSADSTALEGEYEALIQFLYLAPVGLVQIGLDGQIAMMNPIAAQLLMPLSRDGSLDNLFVALENVAPELRCLAGNHEQPTGNICDGLHMHLNAGGAKRGPQILSLTLLKLDASRAMAVISDVTEQVRRERRLRQNEAWFNAILTGVTDYALVSLDLQGRICEFNASIGRVTGFGSEVVGQPYAVFYPEDAITREQQHDRLREADANGWTLDEGRRLRADGSTFWGSALIAPLPDRDPLPGDDGATPAYCLILRDISDQRAQHERRRDAAHVDHLTGLANRRALFEAAQLELGRSRVHPRPTALVVFDADHFKGVNDRHGHAGGDAVLRHLAEIMQGSLREVDLAARVGGEEFAVLLPSTGLERACAVAERLRASVAGAAASFDGHPIGCTVSAGVAVDLDGSASIDQLLRQADQALYAAKREGRNRVASVPPNPLKAPPQENNDAA